MIRGDVFVFGCVCLCFGLFVCFRLFVIVRVVCVVCELLCDVGWRVFVLCVVCLCVFVCACVVCL